MFDMPLIDSYTRADALADGQLFDVTEMAKQTGIVHPSAITLELRAKLNPCEALKDLGQSYEARLWDTLSLFVFACKDIIPCRKQPEGLGNALLYQVGLLQPNGQSEHATIKAVIGPGDDMEPVVTFMLPHED